MKKLTSNIHDTHEVFIQPKVTLYAVHYGLYCWDCVHTHGKKRGNHHWITWLTHEQADQLIATGVRFIPHDIGKKSSLIG